MKKYIIFCYILILSFTNVSFADNIVSAPFLFMLNYDANSESMGQTIASFSQNTLAFLNFPAANYSVLAQRADAAGIAAYDGVYGSAISLAYPIKYGVISAGAVYNELEFSKAVTPGKTDLSYNAVIALNYAYTFISETPVYKEKGALGLTVKANRVASKNNGEADFFSADFGGHYNIYEAFWVFAAVKNIGGAAQIENEPSFEIPAVFNFALRYDLPFKTKTAITADAVKFFDDAYGDFGGGVGAEISPVYPVTFKFGWRKYGDKLNEGPTLGLFLDFGNFSFGYSFASMAESYYPKHTVNVGLMFGNVKNQSKAFDYWLGYHFNLAKQAYDRKDYIDARQQFGDILAIYSNHAPSKEYLSKISYDLDMNDRIFEGQINRWLRRADLEFFRKNLIPARSYYQKVLDVDPENEEAKEGLGKVESKLGAIEARDNRKKREKEIISLWNEAMALYEKGEYAYAKDKLKSIILIDPENAGAKKYLDMLDSRLGKITSAQADVFFNQGMEYYNAEDYESAAKYFNAAYAQDPQRADAKEYHELSKKRAASSKAAPKPSVSKSTAAVSAGGSASTGGSAWSSNQKIQKEIEADYNEALKLFNQAKYEEALKAFTQLREKAVKNNYNALSESIRDYSQKARSAISSAHYKEALVLAQKESYEEAYEKLNKALEYDAKNADAKKEKEKTANIISQKYFDAGMKAYAAGDKAKAVTSFETSLKYNPQRSDAAKVLEKIKMLGE